MPKKYRNGITKQEANDLFISDLSVTEEGLRRRVKVPLFQCEFDVLVSLLYNAGVDLKAPKLFTHLENKEYQQQQRSSRTSSIEERHQKKV